MENVSVVDWLLTMALFAALWQMYEVLQSHVPGQGNEDIPARAMLSVEPAKGRTDPNRLGETLQHIRETGAYRDLEGFMDGAKIAYETILQAFSSNDFSRAHALLGPEVRQAFDAAVGDRTIKGETLSVIFIGFLAAEPVDAGIDNGTAWIEVRFVAQMVSVTTDAAGKVVAGHPRRIVDVAEIWTFSRKIGARGPNWVLVATDEGEV